MTPEQIQTDREMVLSAVIRSIPDKFTLINMGECIIEQPKLLHRCVDDVFIALPGKYTETPGRRHLRSCTVVCPKCRQVFFAWVAQPWAGSVYPEIIEHYEGMLVPSINITIGDENLIEVVAIDPDGEKHHDFWDFTGLRWILRTAPACGQMPATTAPSPDSAPAPATPAPCGPTINP